MDLEPVTAAASDSRSDATLFNRPASFALRGRACSVAEREGGMREMDGRWAVVTRQAKRQRTRQNSDLPARFGRQSCW